MRDFSIPLSKVEVAANDDDDEKYAADDNSGYGSSAEGSCRITAHRSLCRGLGHRFRHHQVANVAVRIATMRPEAHFIYVYVCVETPKGKQLALTKLICLVLSSPRPYAPNQEGSSS